MRDLVLAVVLVGLGCESPRETFRCTPRAFAVSPSEKSETFSCEPGTYVRVDAVGDGRVLRSLVVCDCEVSQAVKKAVPVVVPRVDAGIRRDARFDGGAVDGGSDGGRDMGRRGTLTPVWR